ncbi:MAG: fatty acid desaturase [Gemmatimonadaceae bacterium]
MTAKDAGATPAVHDTATDLQHHWRAIVARYQGPCVRRSVLQLGTTLPLLALSFWIMYRSLSWSYWATLALALPTAGLLVRTFIIMHDCAHASFLPWRRWNDFVGYVTGVLTMTPFGQWRRDHALHHASSGDLDRRGHGDITTITVREYLERSWRGRLQYRVFRHPLVLLGLGPLHLIVGQRFRPRSKATGDKQVASVLWTNAGILVGAIAFSLWVGFPAFALVYLPCIYLAGAAGIWLFYVQHQFEDTYWEGHAAWDYATAALEGSSYFKLPGVLNWFTGHIGLHHVHHLGPKIPNYRLQAAHDENPFFHRVHIVTLREAIAAFRLTLWDEERKRLVSFRDVKLAKAA